MARYLSLINLTDQGIRDIKDSVHRSGEFRSSVEEAGGKVISLYWAIGGYDGAVIFEAPDEATAMALLLHLGRDGFVRTNSMRIYDSEEFVAISQKT